VCIGKHRDPAKALQMIAKIEKDSHFVSALEAVLKQCKDLGQWEFKLTIPLYELAQSRILNKESPQTDDESRALKLIAEKLLKLEETHLAFEIAKSIHDTKMRTKVLSKIPEVKEWLEEETKRAAQQSETCAVQ
jgi:hypothetical protein